MTADQSDVRPTQGLPPRQMADVMTKNLSPKVHWRLVAPMLNVQIPGGAESEGE